MSTHDSQDTMSAGSAGTPSDVLFARYLSGEISLDDRLAVERWAMGHPTRQAMLSRMAAAWDEPRFNLDGWDRDALLARLTQRRESGVVPALTDGAASAAVLAPPRLSGLERTGSSGRRWTPWVRTVVAGLAAAAVVTVGVTAWRGRTKDASSARASETASAAPWKYTTGRGQRATVTLPDGSVATLNAATRLRPVPGAERVVELDGEAYFNVVADAQRPFVVRTRSSTVRVLGTAFGVREYQDDALAQVAVRSGRVSVESADTARAPQGMGWEHAVVLNAGEMAQLRRGTRVPATVADARLVQTATAWSSGWLTLDDSPLHRAAIEVGRWYDLDIRIADSALAERHVSGTFRDETPDLAIQAIADALGARVVRQGRQVTFFTR